MPLEQSGQQPIESPIGGSIGGPPKDSSTPSGSQFSGTGSNLVDSLAQDYAAPTMDTDTSVDEAQYSGGGGPDGGTEEPINDEGGTPPPSDDQDDPIDIPDPPDTTPDPNEPSDVPDDTGEVPDGTGSYGDDFIPFDTEVEDFSSGADEIRGDGDMSYEVTEVADVDVPTSSGTADPTQTLWEVTDEQTVAGQLEELYDRDSPFFETARQQAIRTSQSSGGQNSAMAAQFGELAAMDAAFEVAFADAATYARSAEFNASMANQFSLAEQQFIQNALLSDQAFNQAAALQTQRVEAQLESIVLDYKGREGLMDKELDQWFLKAQQDYAYQLGLIGANTNAQASLLDFQIGAQTDAQMALNTQAYGFDLGIIGANTDASMQINSMNALTNFYIASFDSVMQAANNPNLTPEQSAAALQEGMAYAQQQWEFLADFLAGYGNAAGSDPYDWLNTDDPSTMWGLYDG